MTSLSDRIDWQKGDGLVPAIVQNSVTGRVLMLGYMNAEALAKTTETRLVTFHSRSRNCLWTKGATSGNTLELQDIEIDCDGDTLLVLAKPTGPACHLDKVSCFDGDLERPGFGFVGQLEAIIADRKTKQAKESYTARLMNSGVKRIAQKVGEEGVEVALAAVTGNTDELISETADLIYHTLVLLQQQDVGFTAVTKALEQRHRVGPADAD